MWGALFTGAKNLLGGAIVRWGGKSVIADKALSTAALTVGTTGKAAEAAGGFLSKIKGLWSKTPRIAKVGGGVVGVKEGAEYAFTQSAIGKTIETVKQGGKFLPWLLGAAAVGGLFLAFKDRIFGGGEKEMPSDAAPDMQAPAITLTPEEQLLTPQRDAPLAVGNAVSAVYPAAIGTVGAQKAPPTPPSAPDWQARVGGAKNPPRVSTPAESYRAAEQARAEAAATQQNGVA